MAEVQSKQPVVSVKPQSDVYTLLVIVAILAMAVAIGLTLYDLTSTEGYNMKLADIFVPLKGMMCGQCGYVYDPILGAPDKGAQPGTGFKELPGGWNCPQCGAGKTDFVPRSSTSI